MIFNGASRYYAYSPSLKCTNINDSFTVNKSSSGNGDLIYRIGLLTIDETMIAGAKYNVYNSTFYLKSSNSYWFGSPVSISATAVGAFNINYNLVGANHITNSEGVRPSVSLKVGTQISGGDGTSTNPYVVE